MSNGQPQEKPTRRISYAALVRALRAAAPRNGGPGWNPEAYDERMAQHRITAGHLGDELARLGIDRTKFIRDTWAD